MPPFVSQRCVRGCRRARLGRQAFEGREQDEGTDEHADPEDRFAQAEYGNRIGRHHSVQHGMILQAGVSHPFVSDHSNFDCSAR